MFDLIFPLFVDVEEIRKDIDSGLATTADDLTNKQTLAEIALNLNRLKELYDQNYAKLKLIQ